MPLSRGSCLRISPGQHQRIAVRQTAKQVDRINRRTYGFATRFVYGPTAEVLEDLHELAQRDPDSIPKPIKKRIVMFEDPDTADPKIADENAARAGTDTSRTRKARGGCCPMRSSTPRRPPGGPSPRGPTPRSPRSRSATGCTGELPAALTTILEVLNGDAGKRDRLTKCVVARTAACALCVYASIFGSTHLATAQDESRQRRLRLDTCGDRLRDRRGARSPDR